MLLRHATFGWSCSLAKYINLDVELWCLKEKNPHRAYSLHVNSTLKKFVRLPKPLYYGPQYRFDRLTGPCRAPTPTHPPTPITTHTPTHPTPPQHNPHHLTTNTPQ